jgi:hypothetical protein
MLAGLKKQFDFTGQYERRAVPRLPTTSLDEGVRAEPFDYYDLVSTQFRLSGKTNALVRVYTTAIGSEIKISGFAIFKDGSREEARNPPVFHVAPETIDKAKVTGRGYSVVK